MLHRSLFFVCSTALCASTAFAQGPDLIWGRNFGGLMGSSGIARVTEACIAPDGGVVNGGWFIGPVDLDNTPGVEQMYSTASPISNGFVTRLDASGLTQWIAHFVCTGDDRVLDVATDSQGQVFVVVKFQGTIDVDPGAGTIPVVSVGGGIESRNIVLVKLNAAGQYMTHAYVPQASYDMVEGEIEVGPTDRMFFSYNRNWKEIRCHELSTVDLSVLSTINFGNYAVNGKANLKEMSLVRRYLHLVHQPRSAEPRGPDDDHQCGRGPFHHQGQR
jgi:hypothetical protein